jgi:hypothetical protein
LTLELVQVQAWQVHISGTGGYMESAENQSHTALMLSLDASARTLLEETLEPFVLERPDHPFERNP